MGISLTRGFFGTWPLHYKSLLHSLPLCPPTMETEIGHFQPSRYNKHGHCVWGKVCNLGNNDSDDTKCEKGAPN
jgi:hypothetical protein